MAAIEKQMCEASPERRLALFEKMPPADRLKLRKIYCDECGWKHPDGAVCRCWNDE